jgi:hypothetical protein
MGEPDAVTTAVEEPELEEDFSRESPQFSSAGTSFTAQAQRELDKFTADFNTRLQTRALEKAQKMDEVQSTHVAEAHGELVATPIDTVADIGITIILPFGFLLLGLVGNDLLALVNSQKALTPLSLFISVLGGICIGASIAVNSKRYALKRFVKNKERRQN